MLIIIQILIGGISVNVEPADEVKLMKALTESFKLAKKDVPRPYKLWAMTQYDVSVLPISIFQVLSFPRGDGLITWSVTTPNYPEGVTKGTKLAGQQNCSVVT